jgi:predicted metal-binding membrane protein
MADARTRSLLLQRNIILALLIAVAAAAWAMLIWQQMSMGMAMNTPTMGMRAPLFLIVWVVMMVAMMFPTAAPMILAFHKVQAGKRARGETFVSTWVFVAAYMLIWALSGVLAYIGAVTAETIAAQAKLSGATAARIGGVVLIIAGAYQLSPLKNVCLAKCRTPITFILTTWRDGTLGAVRMGLEHGFFCLGCCWLLFLILFPLGIMNIAAMAVVTLLVFAEKALASGQRIAKWAGIALMLYGMTVLVFPQTLPTFMAGGGMSMNMENHN